MRVRRQKNNHMLGVQQGFFPLFTMRGYERSVTEGKKRKNREKEREKILESRTLKNKMLEKNIIVNADEKTMQEDPLKRPRGFIEADGNRL